MNGEEPQVQRDEDVRQAWRAASDESPPPRVDAAILAAARDAARRARYADDARRVRPWYHAWQPMLAAAAIAGLAFTLVQTLPRDARVAMPPGTPAPAGAPAESLERATAQVRAEPAGKVEVEIEQPAGRESSPATAAETPAQVESGAGSNSFLAHLESGRAEKSTGGVEQQAAPPAAPAGGEETDAGLQADAAKSAVDARIERIVALYRSGDKPGAATELRALRADAEGVDAKLPSNLRTWARTVH